MSARRMAAFAGVDPDILNCGGDCRHGDRRTIGEPVTASTAWAPVRRDFHAPDRSAAAGAPVAEAVLADVARRVAAALRERGITPSLVTILVGDHEASAGY